MHAIQSAPPRRELAAFVRAYAQRSITLPGADLLQPVPASLEEILEFEFQTPPMIDFHDGRSESSTRSPSSGRIPIRPLAFALKVASSRSPSSSSLWLLRGSLEYLPMNSPTGLMREAFLSGRRSAGSGR